jgi:DNA end-binding protein Ku
MPRSLADANISFGLVSIPVQLFTATSPHSGLGFNMLHEKCGTRIKQQLFCPSCDATVERADTLKGYEFEKGKYVRFTAEELKDLEEESTQDIDIVEFVPVSAIDPIFYDKPYYLGPGKRGEKPFVLLAEALLQSNRVGVGTYSARGRSHLVIIRPRGAQARDGLIMQELLYSDEVRDGADIVKPDAAPNEKEVQLALQIVEQTSHETFDPTQYKDERREQVQKLIEEKIEKGGFQTPAKLHKADQQGGEVIDLVAMLQASLKKDGSKERLGPKRAVQSPEPVAEAAKKKKTKAK